MDAWLPNSNRGSDNSVGYRVQCGCGKAELGLGLWFWSRSMLSIGGNS